MSKRSSNRRPAGEHDRIFVRDGFRSYRRTYRVREVRWGLGTGAALAGVVGWVSWKGQHPDPALFDVSAALLAGESSGQTPGAAVPATDRGPLPAGLAGDSLVEGPVGRFPAEGLYVKINGRAGFFRSFGVLDLYAITLEPKAPPGAPRGNLPASIDIELYDLAEGQNAIGAYNAERPPAIASTNEVGSAFHLDRNAGYLARGRYYVRLIGADESPATRRELERLLELFRRDLPGERLPWAFSLFVDQMGLSASRVTYVKNNAFSFGFASDVFTARLSDADAVDDVEAFVVARASADRAAAMAGQFREGFASLGKLAAETPEGVGVFRDEFLGTLSTATVSQRWVVGIRGAPTLDVVEQTLKALVDGLEALPAAIRARAVSSREDEPAEAAPPVEDLEELDESE